MGVEVVLVGSYVVCAEVVLVGSDVVCSEVVLVGSYVVFVSVVFWVWVCRGSAEAGRGQRVGRLRD